jgi:hypothetical protein
MKSTLIRSAVAALLTLAATPAFAADKAGTTTPRRADESAKKYCLTSSQLPPVTTGTIITPPARQCLTRRQWADQGVTFEVK